MKTYFDDINPSDSAELKAQKKERFPSTYLPFAINFAEDLDVFYAFFGALYTGIKAIAKEDLPAADRIVWDKTVKYLELRK